MTVLSLFGFVTTAACAVFGVGTACAAALLLGANQVPDPAGGNGNQDQNNNYIFHHLAPFGAFLLFQGVFRLHFLRIVAILFGGLKHIVNLLLSVVDHLLDRLEEEFFQYEIKNKQVYPSKEHRLEIHSDE